MVRRATTVVDSLPAATRAMNAAMAELAAMRPRSIADAKQAARLLARIRATASYAKGMSLERAAERWVQGAGIRAARNVDTDLLLRGGVTVRPDFFTPGALEGALFIGEVKNLPVVALREQVAHFVDIARANEVPLHLFVPRTSTLTRPLQTLVDEGVVRRIDLAWRPR